MARWAAGAARSFFCFKIPREIQPRGPLAAQIEATQAFVERMSGLGDRLGPFFLQLPPGYRADKIDDAGAGSRFGRRSTAYRSRHATKTGTPAPR